MSSGGPPPEPSGSDYTNQTRDAGASAYKAGSLLEQEGDVDGARRAYESAIETGDPECSSRATYRLGVMCWNGGDNAGALDTFRRSVAYGYPQVAGWAQYRIGLILEAEEDFAGAEAAFRTADELGQSEGPTELARYLIRDGDESGAKSAYQRGDKRGSAVAARQIGIMHWEGKGWLDPYRAQSAFKRADQRGDASAPLYLGFINTRKGLASDAIADFERAEARGSHVAPFHLGEALCTLGRQEEAIAAYQRAARWGDHANVVIATHRLADTYRTLGMTSDAITTYERVASTGDPELAPLAAVWLGRFCTDCRDIEGAQHWHQIACDSDDPFCVSEGQYNLGLALMTVGEFASALPLLEQACGAQVAVSGKALGYEIFYSRDRMTRRQKLIDACMAGSQIAAEALEEFAARCSAGGHSRVSKASASVKECDACGTTWRLHRIPDRPLRVQPPWSINSGGSVVPGHDEWPEYKPSAAHWLHHLQMYRRIRFQQPQRHAGLK
jgi:tetratricopeptide (TPR) repeat protein